MKIPVILSVTLHVLILGFVLVWTSISHFKPLHPDVYKVELVTIPPQVKKVTMEEKKNTPVPKPVQKVPAPEKKTEKAVSTRPKPQKQEPQKEKPKETAEQSGVTGSEVKVDTKDFPFSYYLNLLRYRVKENWQPPYRTGKQSEKMSAVVGFKVERNGKIAGVVVETSSGKFLFDQAAQRAVYAAGPLPPLPEEFSGDNLSIHIEFEATW